MPNKLKILNDPIYGFIQIPNSLVFDIIEHPYFQRLRRIAQMGMFGLSRGNSHAFSPCIGLYLSDAKSSKSVAI